MGGVRITVPLFITCAWEPCGAVRQVPHRAAQRQRRFCSAACAYKGRTKAGGFTKAQMAKGGVNRGKHLRAALLAVVATLSPIEAFRLGYLKGLRSKHRQIAQRRVALKRKDAA